MLNQLKHKIFWHIFKSKNEQSFYTDVFSRTLNCMNYGPGDNYKTSGEKHAIEFIKRNLSITAPVIFDVGANVGGYTLMLSQIWNGLASIHCFEPSAKTFTQLQNNTKSLDNVTLNNTGCSDTEHAMSLYSNSNHSGLTSVYNRNLDHVNLKMDEVSTAKFTTIDNYCKKNNLNHIHFLKMDIEGHELSALQGASNMLSSDNIDYIQFEFGGCNIDSRTYFKDFYYLLHDKYDIFRILQNGLYKIDKYSEYLEIFVTVNYLAIHR